MRDANPMPALSQVQRVAKEALAEQGLDTESFLVIPSETDNGVSYVHIVVQPSDTDDDDGQAEFDQLVASIPDELQEEKAQAARKNLEDMRKNLRDRNKGIL